MAPSVSKMTDLCTEILRAQADLCNRPHDSYTRIMMVTAYVTGIIPVVAVAMRFASRWVGGNHFWWDDWVHLASAVSPQALAVLFHTDDGPRFCAFHSWSASYSTLMRESANIFGT